MKFTFELLKKQLDECEGDEFDILMIYTDFCEGLEKELREMQQEEFKLPDGSKATLKVISIKEILGEKFLKNDVF